MVIWEIRLSTDLVNQTLHGSDGLHDSPEFPTDLEDSVRRRGTTLAEHLEIGVGLLSELLDLESRTADNTSGVALMNEKSKIQIIVVNTFGLQTNTELIGERLRRPRCPSLSFLFRAED